MSKVFLIAAVVALLGSPLAAAPCRDAKGKFTKCPTAAAPAPKRCKDAKGRFAKCGTLGAKAV